MTFVIIIQYQSSNMIMISFPFRFPTFLRLRGTLPKPLKLNDQNCEGFVSYLPWIKKPQIRNYKFEVWLMNMSALSGISETMGLHAHARHSNYMRLRCARHSNCVHSTCACHSNCMHLTCAGHSKCVHVHLLATSGACLRNTHVTPNARVYKNARKAHHFKCVHSTCTCH